VTKLVYLSVLKILPPVITILAIFNAIIDTLINLFSITFFFIDDIFDKEEMNELHRLYHATRWFFAFLILASKAGRLIVTWNRRNKKIKDFVTELMEKIKQGVCCDDEDELENILAEDDSKIPLLTIYPKPTVNLFKKINLSFTLVAEFLIKAFSVLFVSNFFARFFNTPTWWPMISTFLVSIFAIPSVISFLSILKYQQTNYDEVQLLKDFIDIKYRDQSEFVRSCIKTAMCMLRHGLVGFAAVFGAVGHFTTLEIIITSLLGELNDLTRLGALALSGSIAISMYPGLNEKTCGAQFWLLGGKVFDPNTEETLPSYKNIFKKTALVGCVFGMWYYNIAALIYQLIKFTDNPLLLGGAVIGMTLVSAAVACLYYDLPKVARTQQEVLPKQKQNLSDCCCLFFGADAEQQKRRTDECQHLESDSDSSIEYETRSTVFGSPLLKGAL